MLKLYIKDVLASGSGTNVDGHSHGERRLLPQSSTQKTIFPTQFKLWSQWAMHCYLLTCPEGWQTEV